MALARATRWSDHPGDPISGAFRASLLVFGRFWTPALEAGAIVSGGVGLASLAWPVAVRSLRSFRRSPGSAAHC